MAVSASDIKFLLSGGVANTDPNKSIGGAASTQVLIGSLNNLFSNLTEAQTATGYTDYRCLYIENSNGTDSFNNVKSYIESQVTEGASVLIGSYDATEKQRLTLTDAPITGGTITLTYNGVNTAAIAWGGDKDVFRVNMQNALNALSTLSGISIPSISVVTTSTTTYYLDIFFQGNNDNRSHPLLEVFDLSLTGCNQALFSRITEGGPVNRVADQLDFATDTPNNVIFDDYIDSDPFVIGTLNAGDNVPIWIKRITPLNAETVANDGLVLRINGSPI